MIQTILNSKINKNYLRNFLTLRYDPSKTSKKLISKNDFSPQKYDKNGIKTENLLTESIESFFGNPKKSIAISISGGIDSTLVLALIRKSFPDVKIIALHGVFENGFDESITAKKISKKFNADFYPVKIPSIFTSMPELISIAGKSKWNTYNHLIAKYAKKFTDNFVTGDGADEIFGGYTFRYTKFLNLLQTRNTWISKTKIYLECHNRDWVPDQNQMFDKSIKFDWSKIYQYFKPYFKNKLQPLNQVILSDFNGKLVHDFIPLGNTIAKHYDLKLFSPFLNNNVISFGLKLPISQKYDSKTRQGKLVLRKITKRLEINHIDKKHGFAPNIISDWEKNGKKICYSYIMRKDSNIFQQKIINYDWVLNAVEKVENDNDIRYLNRLISILALEIWFRLFITKEIKSSKKL